MIKYPHRYFHYDAIGNMQCNFMSDAVMDEAKGIIDREGGKIVDADNNVIYPAPKEGTLEEKLRTLREMYNRRCEEISELQTKLDKLNAHHRMTYYIDNNPETMSEPVYWHIRKLERERADALAGNDKLKAEIAELQAPRHIDAIGRDNDTLRHGLHEVANKLHDLARSIGIGDDNTRPLRPCTCPPGERPTECQHRYALKECWTAAHDRHVDQFMTDNKPHKFVRRLAGDPLICDACGYNKNHPVHTA